MPTSVRRTSGWVRALVALAGLALVAAGCSGGGGGNGSENGGADATSSTGLLPDPLRQNQFHRELVISIRLHFDNLLADRFEEVESSIQVVDLSVGETEFKTLRDFSEFALGQRWLGFGAADFEAPGGTEFWGIITHVFQDIDGARAVFERFPDPESLSVSGRKIDSQTRSFSRDGAVGSLTVETFEEVVEGSEGVRFLALRGSILDENVIHYVSAVVDVPPEGIDGFGELERVGAGLVGAYRELFRQFLEAGGIDAPTTTTTEDPSFVPADEAPDGGGLPGDG